MAHVVNNKAVCPFHLPVADYLFSQNGSKEARAVLCRPGACASYDTPGRLRTAMAAEHVTTGVGIDSSAFSKTSIDNVDRATPGQRISVSTSQRGFHGTTVQHVTHWCWPSEYLQCTEIPETPQHTTVRSGLFSPAFAAGAGVLHRACSARTSNICDQQAQLTEVSVDTYKLTLYRPPTADKPTSTELAYKTTEAELAATSTQDNDIFAYMLTRHEKDTTLGMKDFFSKPLNSLPEKSIITTVGILPD